MDGGDDNRQGYSGESIYDGEEEENQQNLSFVLIGEKKNPCHRQPDHTAYRSSEGDVLINLVQLHGRNHWKKFDRCPFGLLVIALISLIRQ